MTDKSLPIYQIRDFEEPHQQEFKFYFNRLEAHLQEHAFIQKPHKHDFYIIILITNGTGTHTIDFKTYPVTPRSVFFLSPGQVHSWQLSANTTGYVVFFSLDFYLMGHTQKKMYRYPFFNSMLYEPLLLISLEEAATVTGIFAQLEQEYLNRHWKKEDIIRNYLDIALIYLTRFYQSYQPASRVATEAYSELQKLQDLIDKHFREHLPVSFYAEQLHQTVKQLNDRCKQALGKTTTELVQDRIILEARRLLIHSDLTITQLAAELGFFDNSYFARFFKKHTGQTPEQFRQQA